MMGLSFTVAAGPHQRSLSQVRVPRYSWPPFAVSDSRLPQLGRPGPRIYIPQEQGGPVIPPGTGSLSIAFYISQRYGGSIRPRPHMGESWLGRPNCLLITPWHGPSRKPNPFSKSTYIVASRFVAVGTCLQGRCLETSLIYLPISRSSHSNGSTRYNVNNAQIFAEFPL
jgi:hypothetical protein